MGHDHQQSSTSGAVGAMMVAVLLVAIVGVVAVAGVALFFVKAGRMQSRAVAIEQRILVDQQQTLVEIQEEQTKTQRGVARVRIKDGVVQIQRSGVPATPDARLRFEVTIDLAGNASVDGEGIDLDELKARLAKSKDEASNTFSVYINADPDCPVKHLTPVLDVCEEVGDIDVRVVSSQDVAAVSEAE